MLATSDSGASATAGSVGKPARAWQIALALFAFCLTVSLFGYNGRLGIVDGELMFRLTESLADRGSIAITPHRYASEGKDGRSYSKYGPLQSVAAVPLYLVGRTAANRLHGRISPDQVKRAAVALFNPIILSLLAVATFWLALQFGFGARRAVATGLLTSCGTSLFFLSKTFNSEPLTALTLVLAMTALVAYRRERRAILLVAAGFCFGLGVATRQVAALAIPVGFVYLGIIDRWSWKSFLPLVAPLAVFAALLMGYNCVRFGSPLNSGYGNEHFTTPVWFGLIGIFVSPRCGILFYSPLLLLAVPGFRALSRTHPAESRAFAAVAGLWIVSSAAWWCWWGGWAVGPRLIFPVFPFLAVMAVAAVPAVRTLSRPARALGVALLLLNAGLQVLPVLMAHPEWQQIEQETQANPEAQFWQFRYMPLLRQAENLGPVVDGTLARLKGNAPKASPAGAATEGEGDGGNATFNVPVLDGWASYLLVLGVRPIVPLAGLMLLLGAAAASCYLLARGARSATELAVRA